MCTTQNNFISPQHSYLFRPPLAASSSQGPVGSLVLRERLPTSRLRPSPSSTRRRTRRENNCKRCSLSSVQIFVKEHTWKYGHGVHSVNHRQFSTIVTMRVCRPDSAWQISRSISRPDLQILRGGHCSKQGFENNCLLAHPPSTPRVALLRLERMTMKTGQGHLHKVA